MTKGGRVQLYRVIPFLLLSTAIIISSNRNNNYYGHYRPSLYSTMACVLWSSVTMLHSCIPGRDITSYMEMKRRMLNFAWFLWEETHSEKICDHEEYLLEIESIDVNNINSTILSELDLSQPFLMPKAINKSGVDGLTTDKLISPPLGDTVVPYFSDASKRLLTPDREGKLSEIVRNITHNGGSQKLGTQLLVHNFPALIDTIICPEFSAMFGDRFKPTDLLSLFGIFPALTTVPVFLAGGRPHQDGKHPRTDLHCEPIGNVAVQLDGKKRWTLISSNESHRLRPSIAEDGRAYYFSNLEPNDSNALSCIRRFEIVTEPGDALWVPPWFWHRVDYLDREVSLAASLFHFRPIDFLKFNSLYSLLVIPNLLKELLGYKIQ